MGIVNRFYFVMTICILCFVIFQLYFSLGNSYSVYKLMPVQGNSVSDNFDSVINFSINKNKSVNNQKTSKEISMTTEAEQSTTTTEAGKSTTTTTENPALQFKPYKFIDGEKEFSNPLFKNVRIFCWIMTSPSFHVKRAVHVRATWAQHCNRFVFISSENDPYLSAVDVGVKEGREYLWQKTKAAFEYIYKNENFTEYDWFFKADDDTYAVMENMRLMLSPYSPNESVYFGCRFKMEGGFMSGGAGYVLSQKSFLLLMQNGIGGEKLCLKEKQTVNEDVELGKCMKILNVTAIDSRDDNERHRFLPLSSARQLSPMGLVSPDDLWVQYYTEYPLNQGTHCCSDYAITFHYIDPNMMYMMEYLLYHHKTYGIYKKDSFRIEDYQGNVVDERQNDELVDNSSATNHSQSTLNQAKNFALLIMHKEERSRFLNNTDHSL